MLSIVYAVVFGINFYTKHRYTGMFIGLYVQLPKCNQT